MHKSHGAWLYLLDRLLQNGLLQSCHSKEKEMITTKETKPKQFNGNACERRQSGNIFLEVCTVKLLINDNIEMGYFIHGVHRYG